ncbi:MAG: hypothetical protein HQL45_11605 [Alphaproteobacteria bacterium]|nr:hypothetical protein [Alphaproteobacteria bacterium]
MPLFIKGFLACLMTLLIPGALMAQQNPREAKASKDKVLELCATQKYDSVLTEIDGLTVRFFCDPYMPPLLLGAPGSVDKGERAKPGPAISETLPECPPTDKAYGLCEMSRLDRELRRKMIEMEEKRSFERRRAAEALAELEAKRSKQPAPPPPCTPLSETGISHGMTQDILGAGGSLQSIMPIPNDVRLIFLIKRTALYGPMSRVKEGDLVAIDAIASRTQYAFPILPAVTITRQQASNLCPISPAQSDKGATPLISILNNSQAKPSSTKLKLPSELDEEILQDGQGPIVLPKLSPSGPTPLTPAK